MATRATAYGLAKCQYYFYWHKRIFSKEGRTYYIQVKAYRNDGNPNEGTKAAHARENNAYGMS